LAEVGIARDAVRTIMPHIVTLCVSKHSKDF
jgi:hypothetical protein